MMQYNSQATLICEVQKESYVFLVLHKLMRIKIYWEVMESCKQSYLVSLKSYQYSRMSGSCENGEKLLGNNKNTILSIIWVKTH